MTDARRRQAQRALAQGDPAAKAAYVTALLRGGELPYEFVSSASALGSETAWLVQGGFLRPGQNFSPGIRLEAALAAVVGWPLEDFLDVLVTWCLGKTLELVKKHKIKVPDGARGPGAAAIRILRHGHASRVEDYLDISERLRILELQIDNVAMMDPQWTSAEYNRHHRSHSLISVLRNLWWLTPPHRLVTENRSILHFQITLLFSNLTRLEAAEPANFQVWKRLMAEFGDYLVLG